MDVEILTSITAPDGGTLAYTYDGALPMRETWSGAVNGSVGVTYDNNFRISTQSIGADSGGNRGQYTLFLL